LFESPYFLNDTIEKLLETKILLKNYIIIPQKMTSYLKKIRKSFGGRWGRSLNLHNL